MAYVDIYTAATNTSSTLLKQITVAMFKAAVDIINENPTTTNHDNRLSWARKVTDNTIALQADAARWIWKVLEDPDIQSAPEASLDADVQVAVNSIISYIVQR